MLLGECEKPVLETGFFMLVLLVWTLTLEPLKEDSTLTKTAFVVFRGKRVICSNVTTP